MPWQAARSDEIAGRDDGGNALLLQGAQAPNPHLFILTRPPIGHACAAGCLDWPFPAVLALSSTNPPSRMLAGASAASRTIGSVVEDVKTVVGASSVAAFSLEMTIASLRVPRWLKKVLCPFAVLCEVVCSVCGSKVKNRLFTCHP